MLTGTDNIPDDTDILLVFKTMRNKKERMKNTRTKQQCHLGGIRGQTRA